MAEILEANTCSGGFEKSMNSKRKKNDNIFFVHLGSAWSNFESHLVVQEDHLFPNEI